MKDKYLESVAAFNSIKELERQNLIDDKEVQDLRGRIKIKYINEWKAFGELHRKLR